MTKSLKMFSWILDAMRWDWKKAKQTNKQKTMLKSSFLCENEENRNSENKEKISKMGQNYYDVD